MWKAQNKLLNFSRILLTGLLALLCWHSACGLSTDKQQPAFIQADSATLNHKTGVCIYRGHVKLTQGTTVISSDTLTTYSDQKNQLKLAKAVGQPATYTTLPDNSTIPMVASAQTINYDPQQALVTLTGNAKATQGNDSFAGPLIYYNIKLQTVTTPATEQGRTTIIIHPGQKVTFPN